MFSPFGNKFPSKYSNPYTIARVMMTVTVIAIVQNAISTLIRNEEKKKRISRFMIISSFFEQRKPITNICWNIRNRVSFISTATTYNFVYVLIYIVVIKD